MGWKAAGAGVIYCGRGRFIRPAAAHHASLFSRHICARVFENAALKSERAQGRPDATTHPQPCVQVKKARKQVTTGTPNSRPSLRNGVNGCSALSPGCRA